MDNFDEVTDELEPMVEYDDWSDYKPSQEQREYEEAIIRRMRERRRMAERRRVRRNRTVAIILLLVIILIIAKSCSAIKAAKKAKDDKVSSVRSAAASATDSREEQSDPDSSAAEEPSSEPDTSVPEPAPSPVNDPNVSANGRKIEKINGITYVDGIMIVNKTYSLPADYAPGVDPAAQAAFNQMASDAYVYGGVDLFINSGYRSYDEQESLYNGYAAERGTAEADRVSSRPGHSEHQTGLAFDVNSTEFSFGNTAEAAWLAKNCHLYGFIIRFPEGKEDITGYEYEPWHIRYVGVETATEIKESGQCLEEYLGVTSDYAYAEDNGAVRG
ncbi:MAG: M15 family metallopeptidase [Ruminococcus sp.]|nr:M15 family metallopeptidase [Ruminococcus sp.]